LQQHSTPPAHPAHQPLPRRLLLARLASLAPFVARPMATAQPPATPITSLAGATLFPFLYESASSASRPSRELLVNGRCPERLQGLIGSLYSRPKYSPGCLGQSATRQRSRKPCPPPPPKRRPHRGPPTLGIIGTVYIPRSGGMQTPSL
jgi:hypothetical protein